MFLIITHVLEVCNHIADDAPRYALLLPLAEDRCEWGMAWYHQTAWRQVALLTGVPGARGYAGDRTATSAIYEVGLAVGLLFSKRLFFTVCFALWLVRREMRILRQTGCG